MADPHALLRSGDLDGARAALVEVVRNQPGYAEARMFLFQLFAVLGEWEKAELQVATLAKLSPEAQMLAVAYGQAIAAERDRAAALAGNGEVHVHAANDGWPLQLAESIGCLARGETARGAELRNEAFDLAVDTPGAIDGRTFRWIANADPRFGPTFEAIISGRWGIVPFEAIEKISSSGVRDLRDLVWFPVEIAFRAGRSVAAFLPGRYPFTELGGSPSEKLARVTGWNEAGEGLGQQTFALSGGDEIGLLAIRSLTFE